MTDFMSIDQERVMKSLHEQGISMEKAKGFVLYASADSFKLLHDQVNELGDIFCELDNALPDDSEEDVSKSPAYLEKASSVVQLFQEHHLAGTEGGLMITRLRNKKQARIENMRVAATE